MIFVKYCVFFANYLIIRELCVCNIGCNFSFEIAIFCLFLQKQIKRLCSTILQ